MDDGTGEIFLPNNISGAPDTQSPEAQLLIDNDFNQPSQLSPDKQTIKKGGKAQGNVLTNDIDPDDTLLVSSFMVTGQDHAAGEIAVLEGIGTLQIDGNGFYSFSPERAFTGAAPTTTYTVNTGTSSTLNITVLTEQQKPIRPPANKPIQDKPNNEKEKNNKRNNNPFKRDPEDNKNTSPDEPNQPPHNEEKEARINKVAEGKDIDAYEFKDGSYAVHQVEQSDQLIPLDSKRAGKIKLNQYELVSAKKRSKSFETLMKHGRDLVRARYSAGGKLQQAKKVNRRKDDDHDRRDPITGNRERSVYTLADRRGDLFDRSDDRDALVLRNFKHGPEGDALIVSAKSEYQFGAINGSLALYKINNQNPGEEADLVAILMGVSPTHAEQINLLTL